MTVLVDTGIFFAFYSLRDKHHLDSIAIMVHMIEGKWGKPYITNHILDETLTVLKYRISPETARAFINAFIDNEVVEVLHVDKDIEVEALKLFKNRLKQKGFSYTDAVTATTLRKYELDYILTFDQRSFLDLAKKIIGPNYWNLLPEKEKKRILNLRSFRQQ